MFEALVTTESLIALVTLTVLEIVLGIDNIIFISILVDKLPKHRQALARNIGLSLAMVMRILLLLSMSWIIGLKDDLFTLLGHGFSGRDLILLGGGLFLIAKATYEIHEKIEGSEHDESTSGAARATVGMTGTIIQILLLDIVFSLDSVITAVGMANELVVMILAVIIAIGVMLVSAGWISDFVNRHPTIKMLALSFLVLIGFSLVVEGWGAHIDKGYIYAAMAFAVIVEVLNLQLRRSKGKPVELHPTYIKDAEAGGAVGHLPRHQERQG